MQIINVKEAAQRLGVSIQTARLWCSKGLIPGAKKIGRDWMIPVEALDMIERPKLGRPFPDEQ